MKLLLVLLLAASSYAATLDEQIAAAIAAQKAASQLANSLGSQKHAARIDSLYQLDNALATSHVRVVGGGVDSLWVKIALDAVPSQRAGTIRSRLTEAKIEYRLIGADSLYTSIDRAEKALPVISAALKE